jgi:CheY-like chemotaxis protein
MPKKILFAVSDPHGLGLSRGFFCRDEFKTTFCSDSREAFAIIEEDAPDLAVIEVDIPPWGGDSCCRRVKNDFLLQQTRIILLAPPKMEDEERCRDSGADAILPLTTALDPLLATVRRLLGLPDPGRLSLRASIELNIRFRHLPHGDFSQGITVNLGTGGLFLQTEILYPRDSLIEVVFPDLEKQQGAQGRFTARVAWVNHPEWVQKPDLPVGMGCEFIDLSLAEMTQLERFVSRHLPGTTGTV